MQRREWLKLTMGTLSAGVLAGLWPELAKAGTETGAAATVATDTPLDAAAWHAARRYLKLPQGRVAYVERGTGATALFLHGFPLNGFQWRGALERLSPHRRCIAPDFLGLGYTEVAEGQSVAPDAQVEMLIALLDTLDIGQVDLIANDSGGAVGQLLLVRYPQRIRTLLLTNCDAEIDCPPPALRPVIELARKGQFVAQWLAPWLADRVLARSPQGLGGMTFTHPQQLSDETIEMYLRPLVEHPEQTHAYALGLDANVLAGVESTLRQRNAPTRIIWGTGDTIFSAESPGYLDKTFGNSQGVRRVPNAKLFFPEEFPDLLAEEAKRLWNV
jgi:pimeloyl-ACP methyl ester carboxylesterase